ncbi:hypothetical protein C0Q70_15960 [Pomacea canaliculata]|uniref:Uncharacterized protein n=2 Tax=Pomacea canaliculata TaxID=400727 RepID=A0A2T7NNG6_POMCA|nr:hypothetical protein C0Q70_15960 [Pomacea canaliculata]
MYGLLVLFQSVRIFLKRHSIAQKFMVLQLVLIFHNLQGFIFETLAKKNIPSSNGCLSSTVRSKALQHMILVAEMFLLAFMARILYRKPHTEEFDLENDDSDLDKSLLSTDNGWRRTQGPAREGYERLPGHSFEEHKTS